MQRYVTTYFHQLRDTANKRSPSISVSHFVTCYINSYATCYGEHVMRDSKSNSSKFPQLRSGRRKNRLWAIWGGRASGTKATCTVLVRHCMKNITNTIVSELNIWSHLIPQKLRILYSTIPSTTRQTLFKIIITLNVINRMNFTNEPRNTRYEIRRSWSIGQLQRHHYVQ